jgi:hypothetical protein
MFGQSKALNRIAASITAEDICTPFAFELDAATKPEDAQQQWDGFCMKNYSDPFDHLALVVKNRKAVGWAAYDSFGAGEETVEDAMDALTVSNLVSADTPLLDIAKLYRDKSPWIFVALKGNHPIGWISYYNLLGPAFRACLFGLILAIEQTMADLLKTDSKLAIGKLPGKRLDAAKRTYSLRGYEKRHGKEPSNGELIDCSNFIDKVTIIEACPSTLVALPSFNRSSLIRTETIRNALAHPTPESEIITLLPKKDLHSFIGWLATFEADLASCLKPGERIS